MMKIKHIALAMALAMATSGSFAAGNALQTKMDTVFGSMSNVTKPGVFETQRRGVLSGGSVYVRNPVMNTQLINFQPPSWNASCGGIDFFGGSFSFINADQFVQLLHREVQDIDQTSAHWLPPIQLSSDGLFRKRISFSMSSGLM